MPTYRCSVKGCGWTQPNNGFGGHARWKHPGEEVHAIMVEDDEITIPVQPMMRLLEHKPAYRMINFCPYCRADIRQDLSKGPISGCPMCGKVLEHHLVAEARRQDLMEAINGSR